MPDRPNMRSSHHYPVPRAGGVAFIFVSLSSLLIEIARGPISIYLVLPLLALPLALVGLIDDKFDLPATWRYSVQLLTASLLVAISPLVHHPSFKLFLVSFLLLPALALLTIAVTSIINFTNFMDGLDGLVAGCMIVAISSLVIALGLPWPFCALLGSLFGFLLWNWSPAKVFMGDVGSTFLGAVYAGLVLQCSSWLDALGFLLVATPLFADTFFCLLRRFFYGQYVFEAHRLHLYQRLHQAGWPHTRVALTYIFATAVLAVAMLVGGWQVVCSTASIILLIGLFLDQRVALPFTVASQSDSNIPD